MKKTPHIKTYLMGNCSSCQFPNKLEIHDFGKMDWVELTIEVDKINFPIKKLNCKKCGYIYMPIKLVHRDLNSTDEILIDLNPTVIKSEEESKASLEGHANRYEIFTQQSDKFWNDFIEFALKDWRTSVNELTKHEILDACSQLNINAELRTEQHARRYIISNVVDKRTFWVAANRQFISEVLEIGAIGWVVSDYVKRYGLKRTQFVISEFPISEAHEFRRTQDMAQLFRNEKGEFQFLFSRMAKLNDQLIAAQNRAKEIFLINEKLKAERAVMQIKLSEAYEENRKLKDKQFTVGRSDSDRMKIINQKGLIQELLCEIKHLQSLIPNTEQREETVYEIIEELQTESTSEELLHLIGKTVVVIGGRRAEQAANEYLCTIIAVDAEAPEFELVAALKQADHIVLLTKFVSHTMMWTTKAYAIENDIAITYSTSINLDLILNSIIQA